ncbi:MAG: CsbD family protein [Solirubrobacterales bacterium]|nr:CsbD family protein [Solirubrobacterales bacterium]
MADTTEFKGRVKEAAGDLTDDKSLQHEGKADQASGKLKGKIDDAVDKVKDVMHNDKDNA